MQELTTGRVEGAFQALLRKQDALRDELRGSMLLEVASACQKHFDQKLRGKSASSPVAEAAQQWKSWQHDHENMIRSGNLHAMQLAS